MSLQDTIKELKEQIAEEDKKEADESTDNKDETDAGESADESAAETSEKAEEREEQPKEREREEKKEEEPDATAYARMRREKAAAEKRAQEAEARLAEISKNKEAPQEEKEEASFPDVAPELVEAVQEIRLKKAEREFQSFEEKFKAKASDYQAVASQYALALAQSIKIQNSHMSSIEVAEKTKEAILMKASAYINKGFSNPAEELYYEAKELGFTGRSARSAEKEEAKAEEEIKPDMKKLAANRARSTGMASVNGRSQSGLTRQYIEQNGMPTPEEWSKLPASEKKKLLYG